MRRTTGTKQIGGVTWYTVQRRPLSRPSGRQVAGDQVARCGGVGGGVGGADSERVAMTVAPSTPNSTRFCALAAQGNLIPVYREILADLDTPVSAFLKLDRRRRRVSARERRGRREVGALQLPRHRAARAVLTCTGRAVCGRAAGRTVHDPHESSDPLGECARDAAALPAGGGRRSAALRRRPRRLSRATTSCAASSACRSGRATTCTIPTTI